MGGSESDVVDGQGRLSLGWEQGSVSPCRGKHVSCPTLVYITDGPLREGHIEVYPHREQGDLCQNSILWKIETASTLVVNKVGYYFKNMIQ